MQKILIDTDPGEDIDDLLAITFALKRSELDVRAITTVMWPSDDRARLVKRLLRYMDRTDIPVGAGMQWPLQRLCEGEIRQLSDRSRVMNHACFAEPIDDCDMPDAIDAVDLIIRTVEANPGEVILACIAPLTNIACALRRKPEIASKIQAIALMGGEVGAARVEHNIVTDVNAADIVVSSGVPIAMGTWSVTRRLVMTLDECEQLRRIASPVGRALAEAIDAWHPVQNWKPGPVLYDVFPMVWAMDRSLYTLEPMSIRVETMGSCTRGLTAISADGATIDVTVDLREAELHAMVIDTLLR